MDAAACANQSSIRNAYRPSRGSSKDATMAHNHQRNRVAESNIVKEGTKRGSTRGKNSVNNTARRRKRQHPSQEGQRICPSIIILQLHDLTWLVTSNTEQTTDNNAEYQRSG
jgi:hypothetical protein